MEPHTDAPPHSPRIRYLTGIATSGAARSVETCTVIRPEQSKVRRIEIKKTPRRKGMPFPLHRFVAQCPLSDHPRGNPHPPNPGSLSASAPERRFHLPKPGQLLAQHTRLGDARSAILRLALKFSPPQNAHHISSFAKLSEYKDTCP